MWHHHNSPEKKFYSTSRPNIQTSTPTLIKLTTRDILYYTRTISGLGFFFFWISAQFPLLGLDESMEWTGWTFSNKTKNLIQISKDFINLVPVVIHQLLLALNHLQLEDHSWWHPVTQGRPETILCSRLVNYFATIQFPGSLDSMFLIISLTCSSALSFASSEDSENIKIYYVGQLVPELWTISMRFSVSTISSSSSCTAAYSAANSSTSTVTCSWSLPTVGMQSHEN